MFSTFVFMRSGKEFGVAVDAVENIVPAGDITYIPGISSYFCGVKKLDRQVCKKMHSVCLVIDPGMFWGDKPSPDPAGSRIIMLNVGEEVFGILADSIYGTTMVKEGSIQLDDHTELNFGIAKLDNGLREILLLDSKKLFSISANRKEPYVSEKDDLKIEDLYVLFYQSNFLFGLQAQSVVEILSKTIPGRIPREYKSTDTVPYHDKILQIVVLPEYAGVKSTKSLHTGSMQERLLVVDNRSSTFCIIADKITGIRNIPSFMIEYIPGDTGRKLKPFAGVTRLADEEGFVLILDPDALN